MIIFGCKTKNQSLACFSEGTTTRIFCSRRVKLSIFELKKKEKLMFEFRIETSNSNLTKQSLNASRFVLPCDEHNVDGNTR